MEPRYSSVSLFVQLVIRTTFSSKIWIAIRTLFRDSDCVHACATERNFAPHRPLPALHCVETISTKEIKELCHHWENIEHIVQKWHPNTAVANRSVNLFNDNVMEHFRRILKKKRQKQSTLDIFLICKGPKRQKKESREKSSNVFNIESDEEL